MIITLTYSLVLSRGIQAAKFNHELADITDTRYSFRSMSTGNAVVTYAYPNPPLPTPRPDRVGVKGLSYGDIFWGYVKYSAEFYDFGVVGEDKFIDVLAWNAQPEGYPVLNVTALGLPTDPSLSVLAPDTPPYLFPYLEEHTYRVTAAADGDPNIKDNLILFYDTQDDKTLPILGLRIIVFKYSPDWSEEVVQTYAWNTDVLLGKDGTEQRIKLRATPRMLLEYGVLVDSNDSKSLNNLVIAWGDKPFAVPLWMDCCHTLDVSNAGQKVINLQDTTGTAASDTELFYIPYTNKLYEAKELAVVISPDAVITTKTHVYEQYLDITQDYTIPDVDVVLVKITASLAADETLTVTSGDGTFIETFTAVVIDAEYIIRGNTVNVAMVWGENPGFVDVVVTLTDNSESTSITVGNDLLEAIPAGEVVYPCVVAYITSIDEYKTHTDSIRGLSVGFGSTVLPEFTAVITEPQYKGAMVKHTDPLWNYGQKQDISSNLFIHDYKSGVIGAGSTVDYISGKLERSDAFTDKRNMKFYKNEIQTLSGKYKSFWLPSFNSDINIIQDTLAGDIVFRIEEASNKLLFAKTTAYHDVMIIMNDGTVYYREILSIITDGEDELLELDFSLGTAYIVSDFRRICYMSLVRGNSDAHTLTWKHSQLMITSDALTSITQ